jgi:hypothetical protein
MSRSRTSDLSKNSSVRRHFATLRRFHFNSGSEHQLAISKSTELRDHGLRRARGSRHGLRRSRFRAESTLDVHAERLIDVPSDSGLAASHARSVRPPTPKAGSQRDVARDHQLQFEQ